MMKKTLTLALALSIALECLGAAPAKNPLQQWLDSLAGTKPLAEAVWGACAVRQDGRKIASKNPSVKMLPASNMKLITTGAAMKALGAGFRFETGVACSGSIEDGVLKGDVYIIGGGDPTLGAEDTISLARSVVLKRMKDMLSSAGISKIEGHVIGDGRFFDGERELGSWLYEDIGTYYGTGGEGLSYYKNIQDFQVTAGKAVGDSLTVRTVYPFTPWMEWSMACLTGKAGTGDQLYLYTSELAPVGELRGTFAVDRSPKTVKCSNKYPAYTLANTLTAYLRASGIEVDGGPADIDRRGFIRTDLRTGETAGEAVPSEELSPFGTIKSPPLSRIASVTNHESDNFYAETLLRMMGKKISGSAAYPSSLEAEAGVLKALGAGPADGSSIADGSGLSRKNYVSPAYMCNFLRAMLSDPCFPDYINTIGQPGTCYTTRLRKATAEQKERVYMKSGSMEGVLCYSGYVVPDDGSKEDAIAFSFMTNNAPGASWKIGTLVDEFLIKLLEL
ncbi:MAG: D-alanyl-D-alanine carboxypeptidase [Bacteroidales bacterium]|nr:D-alanyl-D-alanine carboxypeptidase [Bacteroidales bacterium]